MARVKSWVATENHDEVAVDVDTMEVPSETVEAQLVEVEGQDREIENLIEDGEQLAEDTSNLEAVEEAIAESVEEGGMDETAARVADVAVESYSAKWGIQRKKVGLENFGSSEGRLQATKIALESVGDTIKGMWETFINWLTELYNKAKEQWIKFSNAGKSLKTRAEKLEARVDKGLGQIDKKKVSGGWMKQLVIEEKVDYQGCLAFADKDAGNVEQMASAVATVLDETGKVVRKGEPAVTSDHGQTIRSATEGGKFGKKTSKSLSGAVPAGASDLSVSALPGNGYLVSFKNDGITGTRYVAETDKLKEKDIETLSVDAIKAGIKSLFTLGDVLETRLKGFQAANEKMKGLTDAAKEAVSNFKDAESEKRDAAKASMKAAREAVTSAQAVNRAATSSLKNAGAGIAGYLAASIGAYKKAA